MHHKHVLRTDTCKPRGDELGPRLFAMLKNQRALSTCCHATADPGPAQGGDLRAALSGPAGADLLWHRRGKEVALDVVRGLNFLHANGVVHRDIKSGVRGV